MSSLTADKGRWLLDFDNSRSPWRRVYDICRLDTASGQTKRDRLVIPDVSRFYPNNPDPDVGNVNVVWSPDGRLFVMTSVGLFQVDVATGESTYLHDLQLMVPQDPSFSGDGKELLFAAARQGITDTKAWSMDVATGEVKMLSEVTGDGYIHAPASSPDGQWLLMQDVILTLIPSMGVKSQYTLAAVRRAATPFDATGQFTGIKDNANFLPTADSRMVWY